MSHDHCSAGGDDALSSSVAADVAAILEGEGEVEPPVALSAALTVLQVPHHIQLWHGLPGVLRLSLGEAAAELLSAELVPEELRFPDVLEALGRSGVEVHVVPGGEGVLLEMSFSAASRLVEVLAVEEREPPPGTAAIGA